MERTDLLRELAQLEKLLENRFPVIRVVIDADGKEVRRIPRPAFKLRGSEPLKKGTK